MVTPKSSKIGEVYQGNKANVVVMRADHKSVCLDLPASDTST